MGISHQETFLGRMWFNVSKYCYYSIVISVLCSLFLFCSKTAQTFTEYIEAFFYVMICFLLFSWYSVFLFNKNQHNQLIEQTEAIIAKRMKTISKSNEILTRFKVYWFSPIKLGSANPDSKMIYENTNDFVEKLAKYMFVILLEISCPCFMVPVILLSIYNHINNESFLQIFPGTWVFFIVKYELIVNSNRL